MTISQTITPQDQLLFKQEISSSQHKLLGVITDNYRRVDRMRIQKKELNSQKLSAPLRKI